jgi:hypothetical protein
MNEEDLSNNIGRHCIRRSTTNAHKQPCSQKLIKRSRKASPHAGEDEQKQAYQYDGPTTERISQRNPPNIGSPEHEDIDSRKVCQSSERRRW